MRHHTKNPRVWREGSTRGFDTRARLEFSTKVRQGRGRSHEQFCAFCGPGIYGMLPRMRVTSASFTARVAVAIACAAACDLAAQVDSGPRLIQASGAQVRVWTAGLDRRSAGHPAIVLEAGSGADLETWKPVFGQLANLGPVIAYDRLGLGQSGADPKVPTLLRNVETLDDVLRVLAPPPYVLVGHSLGGVIIRGYAHLHPGNVSGLVYLDVPDFESTRAERAAALSGEARIRAMGPPELPPIPDGTPAGLRAVFEQLLTEMRDDFPSARSWNQPPNIPVGVIVTARADRLRGDCGAMVRLQIKHQTEWTLASPDSVFTIAGHTGHQVHRDDPPLVVSVVRHVYTRAFKK
jgi:pimeloyl-ACP methyl ester carboxylesterase